jgi:hypothetical protein
VHVVAAGVEPPADLPPVHLRRVHRLPAVGGQPGAQGRREPLVDRLGLLAHALPVGLAVGGGTPLRLPPRVGLAPALLRLPGVPGRVVVAEDLEDLVRCQSDPHLVRLHARAESDQLPPQPVDLLGHQLLLATEVVEGVRRRVVEHGGDLGQAETQGAVAQHALQTQQVVVLVQPVPGRRPAARDEQADLVVVVQRAHRHPGQPGDLPHGQRRVGSRPARGPVAGDHRVHASHVVHSVHVPSPPPPGR